MSAKYYTILTETGKSKIANAAALGREIKLTHLAVGDGNGSEYDPIESQTELKKENYRAPISNLGTDAQNPNWVIAEGMIPVDVGSWFVREVGIFDEDGDLFAIGKYPETYKPTLAEGTGRDLYIRFIMVVSNTDTIDMKIDPTVAIATRDYVSDEVEKANKARIRNESRLARLSGLSGRLQQDDKSVVITGDSLSYNYQDYDLVGRGNAVDCYPGMNSWSFMLRDAIIKSDPSFVFIEDLFLTGQMEYYGESSSVTFNNADAEQLFPFNGRVTSFRMNVNDIAKPEIKMSVYNDGDSDTMYFLQLMHPSNHSLCMNCKVAVDGVDEWNSLTNKSVDLKFRGFDIRQIAVTVPRDGDYHEIKLYSFTQSSDVPDPAGQVIYNLIGLTSKRTEVELTGTGGFTSSQLLSNWAAKVTQYQPDVLICIVGANDAYKDTGLDVFKSNIREMHRLAKNSNSGCEILWLSTPYSNEDLVSNEVAQTYVDALREISDELDDPFVDIVEFFRNVPPSVYRFDNIHWTREGNQILSRYIANLLGFGYQAKEIKSDYSLFGGQDTPNVKAVKPSTVLLSGDVSSSNQVFDVSRISGLANEVVSAVASSPAIVKVTMKRDVKFYRELRVEKFFYAGKMFLTPKTTQPVAGKTFNFAILNPDGSAIADADWDSHSNDFRFLISYS